ncbi:MAG: DUF134 domain-containing protein [Clostridium sp.]|nr:DUF134 domain-containing protein [Clostridium sp.]
MARPRKHKRICAVPKQKNYNQSKHSNKSTTLTVDEYETIRLIDHQGLTQQECAKQMQVARSTITAVYDNARYKLSESLINNTALEIDGGDYELCSNSDYCCGQCGKSKCRYCRHGSCENCIGIFREPGRECYVIQKY